MSRYICSVLDDMRETLKTNNFSYLLGLIEEAQFLANRMEAAIGDLNDIERYSKERCKLKDEIKKLKAQKKELGGVDEETRGRY